MIGRRPTSQIVNGHATRGRAAAICGLSVAVYLSGGHAPELWSRPPPAAVVLGQSPEQDEVVGPFPSWTDIRTVYGAVGDGVADDTAAIQRALTELGKDGRSPVLWIPKGTYRITRTLTLAYDINLSVVGEDPATTIFVWGGPGGGTILAINGIAYSRFARLTFDGKGAAAVGVEQSWDNLKPHFDTGNEYADTYFVDLEYGIHGGFSGHGFAETTVRRSHFIRNTKAGIALGNFNALDLWVWESTFEECGTAVTNTSGAGNFHVYNSLFLRSAVADLSIGNTGGFSARGNYSAGSRAFFTGGNSRNPATIHLQGNVIVDPIDSTPIHLGNQGPGVIVDNVIRSLPAARGPAIKWDSFLGADVTTVGNTFTMSNAVSADGRVVSIDDRVTPATDLNIVTPRMPGSLPNHRRTVFEVAAGSDAVAIQKVIAAAAGASGSRPVVHLPYGTYSIANTLSIPAGDVQLVGDGFGTVLRWSGTGAGPVLRIHGPSKASLRELQVDGAGRADGILVDDADQAGSRVYMEQAQLRAGRDTNLLVSGLDHTHVQLENFGFAYSPAGVSIKVTGGALLAAGTAAEGRTNIFSGASSGNQISFDVSNGGKVLIRDLWYESGAGPGFARIHDRATVTIDGARVSSTANGPPAIDIEDLNGTVAVLSSHVDDRISVKGNAGRGAVLGLGLFAEQKSGGYFTSTASGARAVLLNSRHLSMLPGIRSAATANIGSVDQTFLLAALQHARSETPAPLNALPEGVTDLRIFRVWVTNGLNNISIRPR